MAIVLKPPRFLNKVSPPTRALFSGVCAHAWACTYPGIAFQIVEFCDFSHDFAPREIKLSHSSQSEAERSDNKKVVYRLSLGFIDSV